MSAIGDKLKGTGSSIGNKLNGGNSNYEQTKSVLNKMAQDEAAKSQPQTQTKSGFGTSKTKEEQSKQQQAKNIANDLIKSVERRTVKADSLSDYAKQLSPERIQEIKETSAILNPEKYHKDVDLGYYGRRAVEGMGSALESFADNMVRARENVSYPVLKAGEFVTSLGGKYDNRLSDTFGKL